MTNLTQCIKAGGEDGRLGWLIKFDYNIEVIEKLKLTIPHTSREWQGESYEWWISEAYNAELKQLFSNFEALAFLQGKLWTED